MGRPRLDVYLVEAGLAPTREKARAWILAGQVRIQGHRADKASAKVPEGAEVTLHGVDDKVGRGYQKLDRGLEAFPVSLEGKVVLDAGASTGGFTERSLEAGATKVYAVDVGRGQLAWKLQTDPRVEVLDRTNIRTLEPSELDPRPEALVMDLSFISVTKVLENLARLLLPASPGVVLIKPQFEAGRGRVGKGGIVRERGVHEEVLFETLEAFDSQGWRVHGLVPSPIRGGKGNLEFLFWVQSPGREKTLPEEGPSDSGRSSWSQWIEAALDQGEAIS